ncbi:substrate-binding domain-containing protein [Streptomyces sp. NBC_00285]|uniref:substrate-binding domain-containing protein n=1 Tax=Streptomyces sp. NBC_00285 TaxID=2975700 RepID=UPI003FA7A5A6
MPAAAPVVGPLAESSMPRASSPVAPKRVSHNGDFARGAGAAAMSSPRARGNQIDAVLVADSAIAAGALTTLRTSELKVPDDVTLVGFDAGYGGADDEPHIPSVHPPVEEWGREAARLMLTLLRGTAVAQSKVTPGAPQVLRTSVCDDSLRAGLRRHSARANGRFSDRGPDSSATAAVTGSTTGPGQQWAGTGTGDGRRRAR